jgi:hypothetical protein
VIENPSKKSKHYGAWEKSQAEQKPPEKLNLLIDIQQKIQDGKGDGYVYWSKLFNLKQSAKTLMFLQENNLTDLSKLEEKVSQSVDNFHDFSAQIKQRENRMREIKELQKHISDYIRTKEIYKAYHEAGYSKKFRAEHEGEIILHQAAKKHFDSLGYGKEKKLPTINMLKQEYATLYSETKKLYTHYHQTKDEMQKLLTAKSNIYDVLNVKPTRKHQDLER